MSDTAPIAELIQQLKPCTHNRECPDRYCGHPGLQSAYACCPNGHHNYILVEKDYCSNLPEGWPCRDKDGCANKACAHPGSTGEHTICCPSNQRYYDAGRARFYCSGNDPYSPCKSDKGCSTDNCIAGKCSPNPKKGFFKELETILIIVGIILVLGFIIFVMSGGLKLLI